MKTKEEIKHRLEFLKGYKAALEAGKNAYSLLEIGTRIAACEAALEDFEELQHIIKEQSQ